MTVTLSNGDTITILVGDTIGSTVSAVRADNPYVNANGSLSVTIAGTSGGNYESLAASGTVINTVVDDADTTTVSLSANASVAEGGTITYTASLTNPAGTAMTVTLSNGATINIAANASSGSTTVAAPGEDVYVDAGSVSATITGTTGGNFENLAVNRRGDTAITDTIDTHGEPDRQRVGRPKAGAARNGEPDAAARTTAVTVTLAYSGAQPTAATSRCGQGHDSGRQQLANFNVATLDDELAEGRKALRSRWCRPAAATSRACSSAGSRRHHRHRRQRHPTVSLSATPSLTEAGGTIVYTATLTQAPVSAMTVTLSTARPSRSLAGAERHGQRARGRQRRRVCRPRQCQRDASAAPAAAASVAIDATAAMTTITDTIDATTVSLSATPSVAEGGNITYTARLTNAARHAR